MKKFLKPISYLTITLVIVASIFLYVMREDIQELSYTGDIRSHYPVATFAGGCFWCSERDFEKTTGVIEAVSGYAGGDTEAPTYQAVASGSTNYREAVQVYYNPDVVTFDQLLDVYWRHINPTDDSGQFSDRGYQYTTAIYYTNNEERSIILDSKRLLETTYELGSPVVTEILPLTTFYSAEDYHQDYAKNNTNHYNRYRTGSGRNQYITNTWGEGLIHAQHLALDPPAELTPQEPSCTGYRCYVPLTFQEITEKLSPIAYDVTQKDGTERPFDNPYWDNKEDGIYVDIVSGEPLFSSVDKYVSGTGWPSFVKPITEEFIDLQVDHKLGYPRVEVRSKLANSHVGHIFPDGPAEYGGQRWCMNSAAMEFIPKDQLEAKGYGEYLSSFN